MKKESWRPCVATVTFDGIRYSAVIKNYSKENVNKFLIEVFECKESDIQHVTASTSDCIVTINKQDHQVKYSYLLNLEV